MGRGGQAASWELPSSPSFGLEECKKLVLLRVHGKPKTKQLQILHWPCLAFLFLAMMGDGPWYLV
jgi:hypothetical protein